MPREPTFAMTVAMIWSLGVPVAALPSHRQSLKEPQHSAAACSCLQVDRAIIRGHNPLQGLGTSGLGGDFVFLFFLPNVRSRWLKGVRNRRLVFFKKPADGASAA